VKGSWESMEKGLRIVKLVAENVKGLKAVEIVPDQNFQVIAGRNAQGKSSVLDAIWLALGGGSASKSFDRPVREGADSAMAQLDLGEYIVTRKWTSNEKSTLTVVSKEGAKFSSPQKMLDELIGKLSFDPLAFANLDEKKQMDTLMSLVDLPVSPIEFDLQKKKVFEERTMVNREVKNLKAQFDAMPYHQGVPEEEIQMSDVLTEMNAAQVQIQMNEQKRKELSAAHQDYLTLKHNFQNAESTIEQLEEQLRNAKEHRDRISALMKESVDKGSVLSNEVNQLVDPDLSEFHNKLQVIDDTNAKVRDNKIKFQREVAYDQALSKANELTQMLEVLESQKQSMMKEAKFPIEGLSFGEDGVLYNGVPFKQCSAAERLKVSMAMAMALNPKLRVIRILDGSLLDSTNMNLIQEMVKEKDYQVWIEVVDESGKVGITIEGGEVKQ
jgi:DNA repair exonuclease SbcCD ATPase subunit